MNITYVGLSGAQGKDDSYMSSNAEGTGQGQLYEKSPSCRDQLLSPLLNSRVAVLNLAAHKQEGISAEILHHVRLIKQARAQNHRVGCKKRPEEPGHAPTLLTCKVYHGTSTPEDLYAS